MKMVISSLRAQLDGYNEQIIQKEKQIKVSETLLKKAKTELKLTKELRDEFAAALDKLSEQ